MSKEEDLLEKAVREEYEEERYRFYSSEEASDMTEEEPPPEILYRLSGMSWKYRWRRRLRRLGQNIASLFVLLIGSFILIGALDRDVRATCFQWIKTAVSGGMTNYKTTSSDKTISADINNESVAGFSLEYIPDGYMLKSADMEKDMGTVTYCKGTEQLIFHYAIAKDADTSVDNENSTLTHKELQDGTFCDLYQSNSDKSDSRLIWQKEDFLCTLYITGLEENDIIRIAEGVKLKT